MKKLIYTLLIIIALTNNSFSAGTSSDNDSSPKVSDYTKAPVATLAWKAWRIFNPNSGKRNATELKNAAEETSPCLLF